MRPSTAPDREIATVASFLAGHRTIEVLSRDRGGGYREAGAKALPSAVQVADRWHLMENASAAFLDAVRKSMRSIRAAIGATAIDPKLLTAAERLQYEGFLRREDANIAILALHKDGVPIKEIMRRPGYSRGLVRKLIRGLRSDVFRTRESTLDRYLFMLDEEWNGGSRNGAELWRRLKARGFAGSLSGCDRVGNPAPSSGTGDQPACAESSLRPDNRSNADDGAGSSDQG